MLKTERAGGIVEEKDVMMSIFERLGGIDAKLDGVQEIRKMAEATELKAEEAQRIADIANESTKSAHKRLDKLDKIVWWVATSIIGAVIVGLMALVIKGGQ
ncbi:hypothetical protein [Kurthia gibsonii]|uniref:hypothetical protein n=1 Tax=Kurthia gibsonii TaxID=33946 RepID=UPI003017B868